LARFGERGCRIGDDCEGMQVFMQGGALVKNRRTAVINIVAEHNFIKSSGTEVEVKIL
jgi:hypothetical protein